MKEVKLESGTYLLVEVPEKYQDSKVITPEAGRSVLQIMSGSNKSLSIDESTLPTGQWSIIGKVDELDIGVWENEDVVKNVPAYQQSTTLILKLN